MKFGADDRFWYRAPPGTRSQVKSLNQNLVLGGCKPIRAAGRQGHMRPLAAAGRPPQTGTDGI